MIDNWLLRETFFSFVFFDDVFVSLRCKDKFLVLSNQTKVQFFTFSPFPSWCASFFVSLCWAFKHNDYEKDKEHKKRVPSLYGWRETVHRQMVPTRTDAVPRSYSGHRCAEDWATCLSQQHGAVGAQEWADAQADTLTCQRGWRGRTKEGINPSHLFLNQTLFCSRREEVSL